MTKEEARQAPAEASGAQARGPQLLACLNVALGGTDKLVFAPGRGLQRDCSPCLRANERATFP